MRVLKSVGRGLVALAKRIGQLQAWVLFTVFYFLFLAPIAMVFQRCADPLQLRKVVRGLWHTKSQPADRWKWAKAQS